MVVLTSSIEEADLLNSYSHGLQELRPEAS